MPLSTGDGAKSQRQYGTCQNRPPTYVYGTCVVTVKTHDGQAAGIDLYPVLRPEPCHHLDAIRTGRHDGVQSFGAERRNITKGVAMRKSNKGPNRARQATEVLNPSDDRRPLLTACE